MAAVFCGVRLGSESVCPHRHAPGGFAKQNLHVLRSALPDPAARLRRSFHGLVLVD